MQLAQDPIEFSGELKLENNIIPISFSVRLNRGGEVELKFAEIPLTKETKFLIDSYHEQKAYFANFTLSGVSTDEKRFITNDLIFTNFGMSMTGRMMINLTGECSKAKITYPIPEPVELPEIRMHVKGFQNFRQIRSQCELGTIKVDGATEETTDPDVIDGYICITGNAKPSDLSEWRSESEKLLNHIRYVMSFASVNTLQAPIIEFFAGDECEMDIMSHSTQILMKARVIHYMHQQPILDAAVNSYFSPPVKIKNLYFAIEWFSMSATHNEVRLVNAMTALENLVASNLDNKKSAIISVNKFDKIRKCLRGEIEKCLDRWAPEEEENKREVILELNEKLADLNRKSIFQKVKALAAQWAVPLDGISDEQIKSAKQARDRIVHRGHYSKDADKTQVDLWVHVTVVRELVVRFLLSGIGYKGQYISYVGGPHQVDFPPKFDDVALRS